MKGQISDLEFEQAELCGNMHQFSTTTVKGVRVMINRQGDGKAPYSATVEFSKSATKYAITRSARLLKSMLNGRFLYPNDVLIVGVGNGRMTSDSLGTRTVLRLAESDLDVMTFLPSVEGLTGIPSNKLTASVVRECGAKIVLAIDALCARSYQRIGKVVQMTKNGIVAGGALGLGRAYTQQTLSVPVIAIGVPIVVSAHGLLQSNNISNFADESLKDLIVAPKDVDRVVSDAADMLFSIIFRAIRNK